MIVNCKSIRSKLVLQASESETGATKHKLEFGQGSSLDSTVNQFVEQKIKNSRLKSIAKNLAIQQSKAVDRKSINFKLSQVIRTSKAKEEPETETTTGKEKEEKKGERPCKEKSLVDYGSSDNNSDSD